jgi:hypothetical protein
MESVEDSFHVLISMRTSCTEPTYRYSMATERTHGVVLEIDNYCAGAVDRSARSNIQLVREP